MRQGAHVRVLLVDDDPRCLTLTTEALTGQGYALATAANAREAIEALERTAFDVVVTDERMPGMSGSELLQVIRQRFPQTMRIVLTAGAGMEAAIRAINDGGVFRYLTKPCNATALRTAVGEALDVKRREALQTHLLAVARAQSRMLVEAGELGDAGQVAIDRSPELPGFSTEELDRLSLREREVLEQIVNGRRVTEIAKALFISNHTVRNHLKAVFRKLDVHSQSDIIRRGNRSA